MNTSAVSVSPEAVYEPRLSASAIISGALVALAIALTLLVLGAAVGITALRPSAEVAKGLGIGFSIWLLISLCIGAFIGALVTSMTAPMPRRGRGAVYGFITWALVTVVGASLAGGAIRATVSGVLGAAKDTAQAAATSPAVNRQVEQQGAGLQAQAGNAVERAGSALQGEAGSKAKTGAAFGMWGIFLALALPLLCSLGGGVVGAGGRSRRRQARQQRTVERRGAVADRRAHRPELAPTQPPGGPLPAV